MSCEKSSEEIQSVVKPVSKSTEAASVYHYENQTYDLDYIDFNQCNGEEIHVTGRLKVLFHVTVNNNNIKVTRNANTQGLSAVGLTSGTIYRVIQIGNEENNGTFINGQWNTTMVVHDHLISQGKEENFMLKSLIHISVNANGEFSANVDNYSFECNRISLIN
ncbi:hypothetical protein [Solitalea lacus]|uniref:hypothetical protein n=1 Tax=Solitalea lacus TaxID=2911172 RepID=UPI001ED9CE62|nr:hypothetical protein [Solitalea lacus]UKJ09008.1 hypothetical protein L2B55_07520 [Solitalea lacus]